MAASKNSKFSALVDRFTGEKGEDVNEWLKKVELIVRLRKLSVYNQLSDTAKQDYTAIKTALVRDFSRTNNQAFEAFKNRMLRSGETPDGHLADLRKLLSVVGTKGF